LRALQRDGLIVVQGGALVIPDVEALARRGR
jgi:hypothetical protein